VVAAAAAFGGVIWFAYQNGRSPTHAGPPPLVKAEPGPVKVKPDQPGGQEIPFQDSSVYDKLGQNGQKPKPEKLLPPTEAPISRPAPAESSRVASAPLTVNGDSPLPAPDVSSPIALAPAPGVILSRPTPPARQAGRPAAEPAEKPTSANPAAAASKPATSAKSGGVYRIQVSAVRSAEAAAPEAERMKRRFPETLSALKETTSKIEIAGKGFFYRIQFGPLDPAAAKAACERLRGKGVACLVVKP
jgi:hypothetical protein